MNNDPHMPTRSIINSLGIGLVCWALVALACCAVARADITEPEIPALVFDTFGVRCGTPNNYTIIAGQDDFGLYGRAYQSTICSTGGRGSRPRKYAVCAEMRWTTDGTILETYIAWSASGASVPGSAVCFGSP